MPYPVLGTADLQMAREKKHRNVILISDSEDDDDASARYRRRMSVSEEDADDLSPSSDDEDLSETSSFHPSCDESEPSESDDDRDYQQSEDEHTDEGANGSFPSDGGRPAGDDDDGDDETRCKRVVQLLREKRDIGNLSLQVYRAYLRKHGLRISGTKTECLARIQEHWRIKDDMGEALYPRSSFVINCTGDVCKGDVVQFRQRVYQKFEKLTRSGKVLGSRTVAGRVVKESYGAAKQQHTFTIEVLWSKGTNKLPPLFPLLIKGRNLYRLKTFRQPWKNEAERSKALDEKHQRGAIARQKRAVRVQGRTMHKSRQSSDKGIKKHHTAANHTRDFHSIHSERGIQGDQRGKGSSYIANPVVSTHNNKGQTKGARTYKPAIRQKKLVRDGIKASTSELYPDAPYQQFGGLQVHSNYRNVQFAFPRGHAPSSSFTRPPSAVGYYGSQSHHQPHHGSYSHRSVYLPSVMPLPANQSRIRSHQNRGCFSCSTRGCKNLGSEGCVISGCRQCCHRAQMRCNAHK